MAYHFCMTSPCIICKPNLEISKFLLKEPEVASLFEDIQRKKGELDALISNYGQEALKELFVEFFEKNPKIEKVGWVQYIPGFNDGDPCVFTMNEALAYIPSRMKEQDEPMDSDEAFHEESPPWYSHYDFVYYEDGCPEGADWKTRQEYRRVEPDGEALNELNKILQSNQDTIEVVFGSYAHVVASKDGFEVHEYDAPY